MRLVGVSMIRNESDIVEAFVRHNLKVLDSLTIVDHASVDGTSSILRALIDEGLPLTVQRDDEEAHRQSETTTRLARTAFAGGADAVFPIDADEFLKVRDRGLLERALASVPPHLNAALHWQTYVLDPITRAHTTPLQRARRRLAIERHGLSKVVLTRAFAEATDAELGPGNHTILPNARHPQKQSVPGRLARIAPDVAALAHLPVRSAQQIVAKIDVGWRAHCAARQSLSHAAFHWGALHVEFQQQGEPSPERLEEIAANYGLPMEKWLPATRISLVDDPLS